MDASKFPPRILLDTGILIRALEHDQPAHSGDPRVKDCRDLWVALLRSDRTEVVISAISILEFLRGPSAPPALPVIPDVIFASFDHRSAERMSKWATSQAIKDVRDAAGATRRVVAYDALIVGTAAAISADCIVTYDTEVKSLATKASLSSHEPAHFRADRLLFSPNA